MSGCFISSQVLQVDHSSSPALSLWTEIHSCTLLQLTLRWRSSCTLLQRWRSSGPSVMLSPWHHRCNTLMPPCPAVPITLLLQSGRLPSYYPQLMPLTTPTTLRCDKAIQLFSRPQPGQILYEVAKKFWHETHCDLMDAADWVSDIST